MKADGQTFSYKTTEASKIVSGSTLHTHGIKDTFIVWCNQWDAITSDPTTWGHNHKLKSNNAFVKFYVDNYYPLTTYNTDVIYTYHLSYTIDGYNNPSDTSAHDEISDTLTISYNNKADNSPFQDLHVRKYSNYYKIKIVINTILRDSSGHLVPLILTDTARQNFKIEGAIVTQQYDKTHYGIGADHPLITKFADTAHNHSLLNLQWQYSTDEVVPIPANYELEWTYIDDYKRAPDVSGTVGTISSSSLGYDMRHNSTRVWLSTNKYSIPLTYPQGYIIYRVRIVRPDSSLFKFPIYGPWSIPDSGCVCAVDSYYHNNTPYSADNMNWQYTVSFAEDGKYKHVANFYDGLLKNRQSITRFNSSPGKLIATNNVYDYEGRPSIKTLPVPVDTPSFNYQHNINLNSITSAPYSAMEFDTGIKVCPDNSIIPPLDSNALASIYYSHKNPHKDGMQQFVPDAEGYPMVETVYEPGYTDRVTAQSGAGPKLQIGTTNTIENNYVNPQQMPLDALMGLDAGWSSYYLRTVSKDPNKQLSMTIKDYKGKLVASSLIGPAVSNGHALVSNVVPGATFYMEDLLRDSTCVQQVDSMAGTRIADLSYYNDIDGVDSLQYVFNYVPYGVCSNTIHLAAKAHYDYNVKNQCGDLMAGRSGTIGTNGLVPATTISYTEPDTNFYALQGKYFVRKELDIYQDDINAAVDSFMIAPNCLKTELTFIRGSVESTQFPCPMDGVDTNGDGCAKMKWEMMQQLFPNAVYGQYSMIGHTVIGSDNSVFSIMGMQNCYSNTSTAFTGNTFVRHGDIVENVNRNDTLNIVSDTCAFTSDTIMKVATFYMHYPKRSIADPGALATPVIITAILSSPLNGTFNLTIDSTDFVNQNGIIFYAGGYTGNIVALSDPVSTEGYSKITFPIKLFNGHAIASVTGTLPNSKHITFTLNATTPYSPSEASFTGPFAMDSAGNAVIDFNNYHYRYNDSCTVASLPDTITVGGVLYHPRTMRADSLILVYNGALAQQNYAIAEDMLPLHPEFCELEHCFNDTFKTQVTSIPDATAAESINLLMLDSIIHYDPIVPLMITAGVAANTAAAQDSLRTYEGGVYRLDTFSIINAYCACNDTTMFGHCLSMFSTEIEHHLLINEEVKELYFGNIVSAYFENRQKFVDKIFTSEGDTCSHCAIARMTLNPGATVLPIQDNPAFAVDTSFAPDSSFSGQASSAWMNGIMNNYMNLSYDSLLMDSTAVLYNYYDSLLCNGQIDSIVSKLTNCFVGDVNVANNLRHTLDSMCASGIINNGNYTPEQILYALNRNGISLNDICNPYILDYSTFTQPATSPTYSCREDTFYTDIGHFFSNTTVLSTLASPGTPNNYTLDSTANLFELAMSQTLGHKEAVILQAVYTQYNGLYTLTVNTQSSPVKTVRLYLRSTACDSFFSTHFVTFSVTAACVNTIPILEGGTGLINEYSFVATVTSNHNGFLNTCNMIGWTDSLPTMMHETNVISDCVPCTELRSLYKQFNDSLLFYGVTGTDHPYYGQMLSSFMNYNIGKVYTDYNYTTFIQSCALADSMLMPQYSGYSTLTFANASAAQTFITALDTVDNNYSFDNTYREQATSGSDSVLISVDLNVIPLTRLWAYKRFLNNYTSVQTKVVNKGISAFLSDSAIGFLYTSSDYAFNPLDSNIFDTTTVKFRGPYTKNVWLGGAYHQQYFYNLVRNSAHDYTISQDIDAITKYLYAHSIPGVFVPTYLSTINEDYYKPEKRNYLRYVYKYQHSSPYIVLDSIQGQFLVARIPLYSGDVASYTPPLSPNMPTNLYLQSSGANSRYFDTLQKIFNLAPYGQGAGYIFHSAPSLPLNNSGSLNGYICSDDSYWYRYFTTGDTMFNVYVDFPAYIPKYMRPSYKVVSVIAVPGDSSNRYFVLNMVHPSVNTTDTIQAYGMTDFVVGKCVELENVLLGQPITTTTVPQVDTFNNCERQLLNSAVRQGIANYENYIDSVTIALRNGLRNNITNTLQEQLRLGYLNDEFNYTTYTYDRADNLIRTTTPAGMGIVPNTGNNLLLIDSARKVNNAGIAIQLPTITKKNTYLYNTLNQLVQQQTVDGGMTRFFYDAAGRLAFSQNDKQGVAGYYTYNIYDNQNRIIETGEEQTGCPYFAPFITSDHNVMQTACHMYPTKYGISYVNGFPEITILIAQITPDPYFVWFANTTNYDELVSNVRSSDRRDVVMTVYDTAAAALGTIKGFNTQENLRKRVSCVKYFRGLSLLDSGYKTYNYATHYSYDIDGNVQTLTQDYPALAYLKQRYKRIDYDYDLISGKVNLLSYNRGWPDQYYQQYNYDADNRITNVQTSADGYIWKQDASYTYYDHGPLARLETGDLKVQGIDYAYSIQGWLKSVNGDSLNTHMDMGHDGDTTSVTPPDAVAFTVDYFSGDYKPIGTQAVQHTPPDSLGLYNGNISSQSVAMANFQRLNKKYIYDQLNRIHSTKYSAVSGVNGTLTGLVDYFNNYTYDADGNIIKLVRYGNKVSGVAHTMDSLLYSYANITAPDQLTKIADSADHAGVYNGGTSIPYTPAPLANNYRYDAIGNMTKDLVSGQDTIKWNLYNKVTATQNSGAHNSMGFDYDGAGNRVGKFVTQGTDTATIENNDYYVHDAQGNILAIYHQNLVYKMEPLVFIGEVNNVIRPIVGTVDFYNVAIAPAFGMEPNFVSGVIAAGVSNPTLGKEFVNHYPVATYMQASVPVYHDILLKDPSYVPDLAAAERHGDSSTAIIGLAMAQDMQGLPSGLNVDMPDTGTSDSVVTGSSVGIDYDGPLLLSTLLADTLAGPEALHLICSTGGDSILHFLVMNLNDTTWLPGVSCDTLIALLLRDSLSPNVLATDVMNAATMFPRQLQNYAAAVGIDSLFYTLPTTGSIMATSVSQQLYKYGDHVKLDSFFNGYDNGMALLENAADMPTLLAIAYRANPGAALNQVATVAGDAGIDALLAGIPNMTYRSYLAQITRPLGGLNGNVLVQVQLAVDSVTTYESFGLSEHDIYGSSRLGIKNYTLQQAGFTYKPLTADTAHLWNEAPWYSAQYQDVIKPDSTNLYGNMFIDRYTMQHVLGQKQYEVTDHLGDVLVTVSDKKGNGTFKGINGGGLVHGQPCIINTYKAILASEHDYYPFGQYMPGRYMTDTTTSCFTTTLTEMVPSVYYTPINWATPTGGISANVSAIGGAVIHAGGTISPGSVQMSGSVGQGMRYALAGLPVNTSLTLQLNIVSLSGGFTATVYDDSSSTAVLGSLNFSGGTTGGAGTYNINVHTTPTNGNVNVQVVLQSGTRGAGNVVVHYIGVPHDTLIPISIVTTVCDKDFYRFGFNGQMKTNEWAGLGNHNTALFWEYDTRKAGRDNPDPVLHPWESPYAVFGGNPIWHNDVLGNDWYKDAKKNVMFDPNVQGTKDLKDGQTYIGKSFSEKTKGGKADYRKDGSIMYSNQTEAYNRMVNAAQMPGGGTKSREEMGIIIEKGVLVLPDYKNNSTTSDVEQYGYKFVGGRLYDPVSNNEHGLIGTIHTHLVDLHDHGASAAPSLQDIHKFTTETPNKPFMTIGYDGNVHAEEGNKAGYNSIQLPKGYSTVHDLLHGADIKGLLQNNK